MSTGAAWEHEVADFLRSKGYHANVRETVSNHEIDVYATHGNEIFVVECKDWNTNVTKDPVRTVHNNAQEIGAKPGLAYTSELTSGARELAKDYDIVLFSADVVRGQVLTFEDVRNAVCEHSISLPNVSNLAKFDDPLGPFILNAQFAEKVGNAACQQSFEVSARDEEIIINRLQQLIKTYGNSKCVPVLRNDRARIDLYFVTENPNDVLPDQIQKESISLT